MNKLFHKFFNNLNNYSSNKDESNNFNINSTNFNTEIYENIYNSSNLVENLFAKYSSEWWKSDGPMSMLHYMNIIRLNYINDIVNTVFGNDKKLDIIDIGCGGGLLSIPLARIGHSVVGLDIEEDLISIAKNKLEEIKIRKNIERKKNYKESDAKFFVCDASKKEQLNDIIKNKFDIVIMMEIIEHVKEKEDFLLNCINLLKPGGIVFLSTINRNLTSFFKAIVCAEYIIKCVPKKTHNYIDFIKPNEILEIFEKVKNYGINEDNTNSHTNNKHKYNNNYYIIDISGIKYNIFNKKLSISNKIDTNYLMCLGFYPN
ncbi:bifunctional 2-polyprenyl-6-hydroxyphenol methylase/3-demethylubiquinol 3-O-methyltransferase UbiG [Lyticum sinuosum]|uniref:Ubiquinone biosynthesis O-methyltransferase n=1 Tax=Lyticum sinuosum TaxID=1332059 RepID=A0AAE4VME4_9RICK|nr:bifunctional 2-polyprenyl-6-hydroxyphenol methylase/3-demethylubiquinol 3-O-methyltransferase UbiG [Lyticum sinuosum]MDZ5761424.1 Ubiquinone biosynthesis O-methyltransferase [Lyticum sinuosum]